VVQQPASKRLSLADVVSKGSSAPSTYVIYGQEKVGKSSLGAQFPKAVVLQTKGETGLETLIAADRLPETPHFPEAMSWTDVLEGVNVLRNDKHDYGALVIDTINGAERQCFEHVTLHNYNNSWDSFLAYHKGYDVALVEWRSFLCALDDLRRQRQMTIVALCHSRVKEFKNPLGANYDRYQPDMHEKTWGLTHRWADAILFLNFETFLTETDATKKGKASGSKARILYTERDAAYDAGNRFGLPPEIEMGDSAQQAWENLKAALVASRNQKDS